MNRAVIYARNSVDKKDSTTIDDQLRMCRDHASKNGFEVVHEYTDPGISGFAIANRPQFLAMMEAVKARGFEELLVMDVSRFSRGSDCDKQLDLLKWYKVRIHDVLRGKNSDDSEFRLVVKLDNIVSSMIIEAASKKSYYNLLGKAERSEAAGGCPYGYRSVVRPDGKKGIEIVPEEAEVVRRIFRMRADGMAGRAIAHILNAEKITSPAKGWDLKIQRDTRWHPAAIIGDERRGLGIVNNEIYKGCLVWNRSRWIKHPETGKRHRENRPKQEWVRRDAPELRIVDDILWQRVRERIASTQARTALARKRAAELAAKGLPPRRGHKPYRNFAQVRADGPVRYVLSGLLKCAVCGASYSMCNNVLYACASYTNCGPTACTNNQRFQRVAAEKRLLASIADQLRRGEYLREWEQQVERYRREERLKPSPVAALREELAKVEASIARLVDALAAGELKSSSSLAARLQAEEATERNLTERLRLAESQDRHTSPSDELAPLRETSEAFADMLEALPENLNDPAVVIEARAAIRDWVGDIIIDPLADGPVARWSLSQSGLLLAAGRPSAPVVAGVGFEPTTFGL